MFVCVLDIAMIKRCMCIGYSYDQTCVCVMKKVLISIRGLLLSGNIRSIYVLREYFNQSFNLNILICKQPYMSLDRTDICIHKQNGIMTKSDACKVILHMNRYNTKFTWLKKFQSCRHFMLNV